MYDCMYYVCMCVCMYGVLGVLGVCGASVEEVGSLLRGPRCARGLRCEEERWGFALPKTTCVVYMCVYMCCVHVCVHVYMFGVCGASVEEVGSLCVCVCVCVCV